MGSEYNEERPKNALGEMTPAAHAKHLAENSYSNPGLQTAPLLKAGGRRGRLRVVAFERGMDGDAAHALTHPVGDRSAVRFQRRNGGGSAPRRA